MIFFLINNITDLKLGEYVINSLAVGISGIRRKTTVSNLAHKSAYRNIISFGFGVIFAPISVAVLLIIKNILIAIKQTAG